MLFETAHHSYSEHRDTSNLWTGAAGRRDSVSLTACTRLPRIATSQHVTPLMTAHTRYCSRSTFSHFSWCLTPYTTVPRKKEHVRTASATSPSRNSTTNPARHADETRRNCSLFAFPFVFRPSKIAQHCTAVVPDTLVCVNLVQLGKIYWFSEFESLPSTQGFFLSL